MIINKNCTCLIRFEWFEFLLQVCECLLILLSLNELKVLLTINGISNRMLDRGGGGESEKKIIIILHCTRNSADFWTMALQIASQLQPNHHLEKEVSNFKPLKKRKSYPRSPFSTFLSCSDVLDLPSIWHSLRPFYDNINFKFFFPNRISSRTCKVTADTPYPSLRRYWAMILMISCLYMIENRIRKWKKYSAASIHSKPLWFSSLMDLKPFLDLQSSLVGLQHDELHLGALKLVDLPFVFAHFDSHCRSVRFISEISEIFFILSWWWWNRWSCRTSKCRWRCYCLCWELCCPRALHERLWIFYLFFFFFRSQRSLLSYSSPLIK